MYTQRNLDTAVELIQQKIKNHISTITKIPVTKLKIDETFKSLGVDSLMALQLKNKIQSDFNITLNVSSVWSYPTVEKYANYLSDELNLKEQYNQNIEQTTAKKNTIETEVDSLSLDELMKQLNDKL
ncbi:MAG: acyl carrier protein [Sphingobacteriales bacterium]|nr:MAG: acyl carrier protein [Sphingobacteriales bacterium]